MNSIITPQSPQKKAIRKSQQEQQEQQEQQKVRCWAHTKSAQNRCNNYVISREGEPFPIPYCEVHMKSGDGALKVVKHPIAGKCLVARLVGTV